MTYIALRSTAFESVDLFSGRLEKMAKVSAFSEEVEMEELFVVMVSFGINIENTASKSDKRIKKTFFHCKRGMVWVGKTLCVRIPEVFD